ncbi:MAG: diacylglycerol kinase family lipid kinase [Candidatus Dormibacteraeota bacterium]|nr:diacylglycerol kinase family lipid kinase [Candidatus Dormibacteraeota bacterium]
MPGRNVDVKTLIVVNPTSAGGRTATRWPRLQQALDAMRVVYDVHFTVAPGDATDVTRRALAAGYQRVIAAGGDGTLNEVVNGFFDADGTAVRPAAVVGMLPSGTGCDFRRTAGIPTDPAQLAALVAANPTRTVDLGRIVYDDPATPARMFINIAACGVGGEVAARVNRNTSKGGGMRGTAVFLGISLSTLLSFGGRRVRLTVDGVAREHMVQNVVIANGRCFGGGMRVAPAARLDDGRFDVIVLPLLGRAHSIALLPSLYRGAHVRRADVMVSRAASVRVEPLDDQSLLFDVEGEQVGTAPATLTCLHNAVTICAS